MSVGANKISYELLLPRLHDELGGRLVSRDGSDPRNPITFNPPGPEGPVLIYVHSTPLDTIVRIDAPVAGAADWASPGLAEVLLREQAGWVYGRVERIGSGILIEHSLRATAGDAQVASTVLLLADTAARLHRDLSLMGALITCEEVV